MTIATLPPIAPSRTTRMQARHRISTVRFGGGHTLYVKEGNVPADTEWSVVWQVLGSTDATTLTDFFESREGTEPFLWTPPNSTRAQRFICPQWQITPEGVNHAAINARFIRLNG